MKEIRLQTNRGLEPNRLPQPDKDLQPNNKLQPSDDYGRKRKRRIVWIMAILTFAVAIAALSIGRFRIPFIQVIKILLSPIFDLQVTWTEQMENVIFNVRLHRVIAAMMVGAALSLSGCAYQGVFRNPLVSADILGVTSGACVGAALAILLNLGSVMTEVLALIFGLATVGMAMLIPRIFRNNTALMLVLAGVIVRGFMTSMQGIEEYLADTESQLPDMVYWTMGSLASVRKTEVWIILPFMVIAGGILIALRWRINLLSLGEDEAKSLGINVTRTRSVVIFFATALTACAVCMSGTIGWIGLIIPHFSRMILGDDNVYLMPVSALLGATYMTIIDTLARNLTGGEIPLSILTGAIGAPLFVLLMARQQRMSR